MIENDFHIANLIARFVTGDLTSEEEAKLESWRHKDEKNEILFQRITKGEYFGKHLQDIELYNKNNGWNEVQKRILRRKRKGLIIKTLMYAAVFILPVIVIGVTFFMTNRQSFDENALATTIQPGKSEAILTLDNGNKIILDRDAVCQLKQVDETHIQIDSTTLNYQKTATLNKEVTYNKIETPRGSEYCLLLSDGTRVHLNAMSSLRYPTKFNKQNREVELTGEAFFEVASNGQPFIVHVNNIQVEVLGTKFNLSAYPQEACQTTLVSGSVKVKTEKGNSCILKPSEQATIEQSKNHIQIKTVDTSFYTSWIEGEICFKDQRLEDIITTLSRWYDMKVIYTDEKIKDLRFGCHVNRYESIIPFIQILEETKRIRAKIKEKTIILYNY